ncbi:hypothetical protein KQ306_06665 [Synechococcus sp. CS-1324]|uniref:hypothetical protein n=1 Tax=Synechococcus sp. CS-1324 TaxID=2847980 RepID=UPI000DB87819|nr:hypothetical protein [Synechococcus sp. CS-1324]MCT0230532.1 hypothetical protein [Synechococcus sp. CS-1324]PZV03469.1 MAG: hypothetical protein DCF23_09375 [Cyanobium sp.]
MALFVILTVILGSVAMASRTTLGNLSAAFQGESREAREAAEAGLATVISTLNQEPNRKLLVSAVPLNSWAAGDTSLQNPCAADGTAPTATAINFRNGAVNTIAGNANRRFVLRSVEIKNSNRNQRFFSNSAGASSNTGSYNDSLINLDNAANVGYIALTIEGQVLNAGGQVATATVTREFQVVPKCCKISFGTITGLPAHGNDPRACDNSFPRLLVGAALEQPGVGSPPVAVPPGGVTFADSGAQLRVQNEGATSVSANKPPDIICLTRGTCPGVSGPIDGSVPVRGVGVRLPALPVYPPCPSGQTCPGTSDGIAITSNSICSSAGEVVNIVGNGNFTCTNTEVANSRDYLRVNDANTGIQLCNTTNTNLNAPGTNGEPNLSTTIVNGSCSGAINSFCARTGSSAADYAYHCRIRSLTVSDDTRNNNETNRRQNNTFVIDSSRAPIYLYLNSEWNAGNITTVDNWDDGQIQHVKCATPTSGNTACATRALPDDSSRAAIYSNREINVQVGDDGYIRDLFMYLPYGTLTLREDPDADDNPFGMPNYRGSLWVNNLSMGTGARPGYNTQIAVPPLSGSFYGLTNSAAQPFRLPIFDWVARSSASTSLF